MKADPNTIEAQALETLAKPNPIHPINVLAHTAILNHVFKHRIFLLIERLVVAIENKIKSK